jgi:hypothetical protein
MEIAFFGHRLNLFLIFLRIGDLEISLQIHAPCHEDVRTVIDTGLTTVAEVLVDANSHIFKTYRRRKPCFASIQAD